MGKRKSRSLSPYIGLPAVSPSPRGSYAGAIKLIGGWRRARDNKGKQRRRLADGHVTANTPEFWTRVMSDYEDELRELGLVYIFGRGWFRNKPLKCGYTMTIHIPMDLL